MVKIFEAINKFANFIMLMFILLPLIIGYLLCAGLDDDGDLKEFFKDLWTNWTI